MTRDERWFITRRHNAALWVALLLVSSTACKKTDADRTHRYIADGDRFARVGKYPEASIEYRDAIKLTPSSVEAHEKLADAAARGGQPALAADELMRVAQLAPGLPAAHVALGSTYWSAGNVVEAEAELRKSIALSPADPSANRALAIFLMATGRGPQAEPAWAVVAASPRGFPFALADYFIAMNRLSEAERALVALSASEVNRDAARVRLAAVQSARNRPVDARRTIETVLRDAPHSVPALLVEARLLQSERRFDEALRVAQSAAAASPDQLEPLLVQGDIFAARGDDEDADRSFERAAALNPSDPRPCLAQAKIRLARGRALESVRFVERARAIAPNDFETRSMLIGALARAGQRKAAIQAAEAAIGDWPRLVALYLQLGRLQFADGRPDEARATFSTAIRLDPTSIAALRALVELEMRGGQPRSALTRIEQRLQKQPDSSALLLLAGQVFAADHQDEKAQAMFARLVELDPSGSGGTMLGILLEEQNHPADAERAFERALTTNPFDGIAANNLAWLYQQEGRLDEALRWATVANEQLRSVETNDTLGWIHVRRGECREALPMLRSAIQARPENPLYYYHLAVAYSKTGSTVQALDELHRALAFDMTFSGREEATRLRATLEGAATPR